MHRERDSSLAKTRRGDLTALHFDSRCFSARFLLVEPRCVHWRERRVPRYGTSAPPSQPRSAFALPRPALLPNLGPRSASTVEPTAAVLIGSIARICPVLLARSVSEMAGRSRGTPAIEHPALARGGGRGEDRHGWTQKAACCAHELEGGRCWLALSSRACFLSASAVCRSYARYFWVLETSQFGRHERARRVPAQAWGARCTFSGSPLYLSLSPPWDSARSLVLLLDLLVRYPTSLPTRHSLRTSTAPASLG